MDETPAARASVRVREGAAIRVRLPPASPLRERPLPEQIPLDVLYEDEHLLALNKPAGIVVHPSYRNTRGTLLNGILWHLRDRPAVRPGLVSRLDKDTSGVVLVALSPGVHAHIQRDAHAGRVVKQYLAIVRGSPRPSAGVIALPLQRDPRDRRRVIVGHGIGSAPSDTRYRVVSTKDGYSMVQCELVTGRTHQIRVHLAASGWPIVGDTIYGLAATTRISRQALHAWRIVLPHPVTFEPLSIEAPVPADLESAVSKHD